LNVLRGAARRRFVIARVVIPCAFVLITGLRGRWPHREYPMTIHLPRTAVAVALTIVFQPASAAVIEDEAAIVVVATRQPSRVSAIAADVSIIEREQIEAAGPAATLGDLLSNQAGIQLSREGSRGAGEGVFIRGANSGHTLVLVDDLRIGSATLGITSIGAIPLSQVQRIEILRGSASALYGSEAIGGVIRIFTRQGDDAPRLDVRLGTGSHGTQEASLAHAGKMGTVSYAIRAGDSRATGVNAITNPTSPAYNEDKDGYWRRHVAIDVGWRPDQSTELGVRWLNSEGVSRYDSSWPDPAADYQTRLEVSSVSVNARRKINNDWTTELRIGRGEDDSVITPSATFGQSRDAFRTSQDQFVWQNDLRLPIGRGLIALEKLREAVVSTNVYTRDNRSTSSLVLGWNGSIDAHVWQVGSRHDDNSQFGGKTTHALNYGYRFAPGWRVSAGTGTSYKAPTFNDLYFPYTPFMGGGNPNLVPETSRSREVALNYADATSEASLTAFRNDIRNLIQWEEFPLGSFEYFPSNVGSARITGVTAAGKVQLGSWSLRAHVTAQSPRNRDTGEYLVRRSKHYGGISADRTWGSWSFGTEIKAAGMRYDAPDFFTRRNTRGISGYGILNLHGEYKSGQDWSMFARIDNLFDKDYQLARASSSEYASLGSMLFVGVRHTLK
jgi:vitamin B12 transporter